MAVARSGESIEASRRRQSCRRDPEPVAHRDCRALLRPLPLPTALTTPRPESQSPMPDVRPFRGVRYDMAQVGALSDVVAPPYDVIDRGLAGPALPGQPVQHHPPRAEPGGARRRLGVENRYTRAARVPQGLAPRRASSGRTTTPRSTSTSRPSRSRARRYTRKGFLARVRLEPFGQGKIFPHEQTLAGPKADRLALFQATGFNLSPIFGLYPDADARGPPVPSRRASATGPRWRRPTTSASSTGSGSSPTQDAHRRPGPDGREADLHRRRPPPLRDRAEVSATTWPRPGSSSGPDDPANFCMMMLVG